MAMVSHHNDDLQRSLTVKTQPGPIEFTLPFGAIFTISFLSDIVSPYIMAVV